MATEPKKLTPERLASITKDAERYPETTGPFTESLLAHIAALEQTATVKGALDYCKLANAERDAAIARAEAAEAEVDAWRGCVRIDATMEGPRFMGLSQSEARRVFDRYWSRAALSTAKETET